MWFCFWSWPLLSISCFSLPLLRHMMMFTKTTHSKNNPFCGKNVCENPVFKLIDTFPTDRSQVVFPTLEEDRLKCPEKKSSFFRHTLFICSLPLCHSMFFSGFETLLWCCDREGWISIATPTPRKLVWTSGKSVKTPPGSVPTPYSWLALHHHTQRCSRADDPCGRKEFVWTTCATALSYLHTRAYSAGHQLFDWWQREREACGNTETVCSE